MGDIKLPTTCLYKYRGDIYRDLLTLKNGEIYIPSWDSLNDPNESSICTNRIKDELRFIDELLDADAPKNAIGILKGWEHSTGIYSLSKRVDNENMWAHYANNHRGMCVEYDLLGINSALKFTAVPVIYSQERACFNFFKLESMQNDAMSLFVQSLTSKSPEWSYEKEWRIIRDQESCGNQWDTNRKGALLEMIRPSSIILGCATEQEFEKEVRKYCENSRITLYKMEKDPVQYQLNKKVILEFDKEA